MHPASWYVTFILAIGLLTVSARPAPESANKSDASAWTIITLGLILFIVAIFVYPMTSPSSSANDDLAKRVAALESRQAIPSPQAQSDARVPELLSKVNNLQAKLSPIDDLIRTQNCLDRLNSQVPKELVDTNLENARKFVKTSTAVVHDGGSPVDQWSTLLNNTRMYVLAGCYPGKDVEFNYEPTAEQLENPVPDEPQTTNIDLTHRYRRFYLQSQFAYQKLEDVRRGLQGMVNSIKEQISNSKR
jgi:hypothetical protein